MVKVDERRTRSVVVRLHRAQKERLLEIGRGNLSEGVRRVLSADDVRREARSPRIVDKEKADRIFDVKISARITNRQWMTALRAGKSDVSLGVRLALAAWMAEG